MKIFIKENWFRILLLLILCIFGFLLIKDNSKDKNVISSESTTKKSFSENDISNAVQITCTYPQILNVKYYDSEVSHNLPKPETNPLIFTFSKINDPKEGQLSYIDSTQTISSIPIIKISEDNEKIMYIDKVGTYLTTHTIYKKLGVSVYTKSLSLIGIPTGSLAMGTCVGY